MSATVFFRTKLWLWVAVTAALVLAAGYVPIVRSGGERLGYWGCWGVVLRGGSFVGTPADTGMILVIEGVKWGALIVALGWVVHRGLLAALFRGAAGHTAVRGSSPLRTPGRPAHRRTAIAAAVVGVATAAPFAACGLAWLRTPPLPKAELRYPDGVSFHHGEVV